MAAAGEGSAARGSRPGTGRGGRTDASAAGLPVFCRPRHYVRGANVFVVPLWDFSSRWLPEDLKAYASSSQPSSASAAAPAAAAAAAPGGGAPAAEGGDDGELDEAPGANGPDDDGSGSESEHSEIAWDGPLGGESRVWSRAEVDSALMLLRRVQGSVREPASAGGGGGGTAVPYGLAVSSALFAPGAQAEGSDAVLDRRLAQVLRTREPNWAVVALRSGHFAGAVFKGPEPVVHKAVHRYTVRAKAGGSQSAKDNTGKTIKSAGSNLRRYGEQRLAEEIREFLTEKWAAELASCELIFISVSKRMRSTLIGTEKDPYVPFSKVRKLPFMVGRPTFEAVKDAYLKVAGVVFADEQVAEALAAKFRPAAVPEPEPAPAVAASEVKAAKAPEPAPAPKYREEEDELFTPLHAAAAAGDDEKIMELLDDGADPSARDGKGRVAYYLCSNNRSREAFRRWRGANEDAWDWDAAQVPEGLTEELEQRKKDKEKEKKKKQKEKQKAGKAAAKFEEAEKQRKDQEEAAAMEAAQTKCERCKKGITGKPFSRLSYYYCSTDCVSAHRRELQAEAAMKRLGGDA